MNPIFRLLCLIVCISFAFSQKTLTTYQESIEIYPLIEPISLTEPSWNYLISISENHQHSICICSEVHGDSILFNDNGFLTLLNIQSGQVTWKHKTPLLGKFVTNEQSILILENNSFTVLDLTSGIILNTIPISAQSQHKMYDSTYKGKIIFDYILKNDVIYFSSGSIEDKWTLSAIDRKTGGYLWNQESSLTHQFLEITNDVIISFAHQPLTTGSIYAFTSTKTGEQLWGAGASTRMGSASIVNIDNTSIDLFQSRSGSADSIGGFSKHALATGEKLGFIGDYNQGCIFQSTTDWNSSYEVPSITYILDVNTFIQDKDYMYIQSKSAYGIPKIYRQKRCDHPDFDVNNDDAIMYISFDEDKEWIAGPVNNTFIFTDNNGLYHVSLDSLETYETRVVKMPQLGQILTTTAQNSLFFQNYNGINSKVTHLRILKEYLLSGSQDGMFHVHNFNNSQLLLKADLDAEIILESFSLDNGFLVVVNNQISYFDFQK